MFKFLREVVTTTVDASAFLVKGTVKVSTSIVAGTAELVGGENEVTKGIRAVGEGASKATDFVVDKAASPLAKAIGKGVVRKAERVYDVGAGLGEALLTDRKKEGLVRAGKAVVEMALMTITAGSLAAFAEHFGEEVISAPAGNLVQSVADYIDPDVHADAAAEMVGAGSSEAIYSGSEMALSGGHTAVESSLRFGEGRFLDGIFGGSPAEAKQFVLNLVGELNNSDHSGMAASLQEALSSGKAEQVRNLVSEARDLLPSERFLAAAEDVRFGGSLKS